jgi:hypothetical protein
LIVGGSAGVPSACSSLKVKVIQPPFPGPDGELSVSEQFGLRFQGLSKVGRTEHCANREVLVAGSPLALA